MMWLPSLLLACAETCPTPASELNERDWAVFVQAVDPEIDNEEAFPAESSPGNGTHIWRIDWDSPELVQTDPTGEVTVTIDEQPFEGKGYWSTQECGNFTVTFAGEYIDADSTARHSFAATGLLAVFEGKLEGFLDWQETWRAPDGQIGSFTSSSQLFGSSDLSGVGDIPETLDE
jgi:hypothetical protein